MSRSFKISLVLFILLVFVSSGFAQTELKIFFSPGGGCQEAIIEELSKATETIDVAMYYFTSQPIASALLKAKDRGIIIRVYLDEGQRKAKYSQSRYLKAMGIAVRYEHSSGLMHHKFAIIDEKVVITGSYNWTKSAEERNDENIVVIYSEEIAKIYKHKFEELWSQGTAYLEKWLLFELIRDSYWRQGYVA